MRVVMFAHFDSPLLYSRLHKSSHQAYSGRPFLPGQKAASRMASECQGLKCIALVTMILCPNDLPFLVVPMPCRVRCECATIFSFYYHSVGVIRPKIRKNRYVDFLFNIYQNIRKSHTIACCQRVSSVKLS